MKNTSIIINSVLVFLLAGCNSNSPQNDQDQNNQAEQSEENETLYQSTDFTEPGKFTKGIEGPAVGPDGTLYVVNFEKEGTIGQVNAAGEASLFVNLPEGSIGNGIRFNSKGTMLIADYTKHNVLQVDMDTKNISVFANNKNMNQPQ